MNDDKVGGPVPGSEDSSASSATETTAVVLSAPSGGNMSPPKPPPPPDDGDGDDEGMLRMSFMEHLEELRSRIIKCVWGVAIAFVVSMVFSSQLWDIIRQPAVEALKFLKVVPPRLTTTAPMES